MYVRLYVCENMAHAKEVSAYAAAWVCRMAEKSTIAYSVAELLSDL